MKFDTVVIGGGLAGLTAAIALAEQSQKVAVVTTGRSTMHFNSGSMGLLGFDASHRPVADIPAATRNLDTSHPYSKIGIDRIASLQTECRRILSDCGATFTGSDTINHSRISPLGILRPAWVTLEGMVTLEGLRELPGRNIAIVGIAGFLDFYPRFLAAGLAKEGFQCTIHSVDTALTRHLRQSESEMRAANISRSLTGNAIAELASAIDRTVADVNPDAVIFPAVAGLADTADYQRLRTLSSRPLFYGTTLGTSVPGIMVHDMMMRRFRALGGACLNNDNVISARYDGDRLSAIATSRLDDDELRADNFIYAAGRFFSHGLRMLPTRITDPALGLDIADDGDVRYNKDLFAPQPFMKAGIATDSDFSGLRSGKAVANVKVVGSALAGVDSLSEESGAGTAMLTAIHIAKSLIKK